MKNKKYFLLAICIFVCNLIFAQDVFDDDYAIYKSYYDDYLDTHIQLLLQRIQMKDDYDITNLDLNEANFYKARQLKNHIPIRVGKDLVKLLCEYIDLYQIDLEPGQHYYFTYKNIKTDNEFLIVFVITSAVKNENDLYDIKWKSFCYQTIAFAK